MDQLGSGYSVMHSSNFSLICCLIDNGVKCSRRAGNASYHKRVQKVVLQRKLRLEHDRNADHSYICDAHKSFIQQSRSPHSGDFRLGSASSSQQQVSRLGSSRGPVTGALQGRVGAGVSGRLGSQNQQVSGTLRKRTRVAHGYATPPSAGFGSANSQVDGGVDRDGGFVDLQQVNFAVLRRYKKAYKVAGAKPGASKAHFADVIAKHFRTLQCGNEYDVVKTFIMNVRSNRNRLDQPAYGSAAGTTNVPGADVAGGAMQTYVSSGSPFVGAT